MSHIDIETDSSTIYAEIVDRSGPYGLSGFNDLAAFVDGSPITIAPPQGVTSFNLLPLPTRISAQPARISMHAGAQSTNLVDVPPGFTTYYATNNPECKGVFVAALYTPLTFHLRI
jgi:hypothetical protein